MTIHIKGSQQPFDISWDNNGLVHVFANNQADAFRGMGYAAGYERLWQIHLSTLYATGAVAEVMGPRYVAQDLMHRAFNVPAYDMPDSPGDWVVDAYLEGLNSYVRELDHVPAEFARAGTLPREFTRHDVASRHRFTGWFQHKTFMEKIYMGKLMARHGTDWFKHHLHNYSAADGESIAQLREALLAMDAGVGKLLFPQQAISGSNNWAVRGALSASGKPLQATDPHQPLSIPNTFFYVHLSTPDWDTFGATFPGIPYFMMGFNRDVSWGLTTGFIDSFDVFVERDEPFDNRHFDIAVAGEQSRSFDIAHSPRGPLLESISDSLGLTEPRQRDYHTALNWVMRDIPTSAGTLATMPLATNAKQFGESLFENNICPLVNNIICVDRDDEMRRFVAATVPKRPGYKRAEGATQGVTGSVPLAGWDNHYPFELSTAAELSVEHNPECGYCLTANNDTMGDRGTFPIANFPIADARARRIEQLLQRQICAQPSALFRSADFEAMQLDLIDLQAKDWAPAIAACLVDPAEPVQRARKLLEQWDYSADIDSAAACLYYPLMDRRWHSDFMHAVLGDDLLHSMPVVAVGLMKWSITDFFQPGSPWLAHRDKLQAMLCQQVAALVERLDHTMGSDWRWGKLQQVEFKHSLGKHAPWKKLRVGPDPIGGSGSTLRMALRRRVDEDSEQLRVYHGPAFRWVVDLADPLHFRFIIAGGNSGRTDSEHSTDQYGKWLRGEYIDVSLLRDEIEFEKTIEIR